MSQVKDLIKEINKGKNLEQNIPFYKDILFDLYNQVTLLHITMDYYVLYESMQEKKGEENGYLSDAIRTINEVVEIAFSKGQLSKEQVTELTSKVEAARSDVIKKMEILTMYTDRLQIYEHVVNRIELRYEEDFPKSDIDVFVEKVYKYIFSGSDNAMINESIKEVLSELPVRMARSKYFQLIENSLSVYKDSDRSAVQRYLYMLETSAMLYEPEGVGEYFPEMKEFAERLSKVQFGELSFAEFQSIYKELEEMAEYIGDIADLYVDIQGILNSLYGYLLSYRFEESTDEGDMACHEVVRQVAALFTNGKWQEISEDVSGQLVKIEGKQEMLIEDMLQLETVLPELLIGHEEQICKLGYKEEFENLEKIQQLLSSASTFIDFEEQEEDGVADEAYLAKVTQELLEKLRIRFAEQEMCVNRAVIAATISKFPVFFTSSKEVKEYIEEALLRCQDDAERQASMNVIEVIMGEADNLTGN